MSELSIEKTIYNCEEIGEFFKRAFESIKGNINPSFISNPQFQREFYGAFYIPSLTIRPFKCQVKVSDNGNITIFGEGVSKDFDGDCNCFVSTIISLNGNSMVIDKSQGKLHQGETFNKEKGKVLSTSYSQNIIDENGIELSCSTLYDTLPIKDSLKNVNISDVVLDCRPTFYNTLLPEKSKYFSDDVRLSNKYRTYDNLGIVYETSGRMNHNGVPYDVEELVTLTSVDYPDRLVTFSDYPLAFFSKDSKEWVVTSGENFETACDQVKKQFTEVVNMRFETRRNDPQYSAIYEVLNKVNTKTRKK